jgi:DUF971 family protein
MTIHPVSLARQRESRTLRIEWSDGIEQVLPYRLLRDHCPCAGCRTASPDVPSRSGKASGALRVLSPAETRPLEIERMSPVGNYAYHIQFSDGHNTGIYTFELLRSLRAEA